MAETAKKNKLSKKTIYSWPGHINVLQPQGIKRLKALEAQNNKLKKLLAELDLEIDLMREINRKKW